MNKKVEERIQFPVPKKILTCDGGGILGLMSVEILTKIETDLRIANNKPDLVLADYFDFVCGTSTGAIIAACISSGMSMDTIRQFYLASGKQMFDKASVLKRLQYSYNDEPLAKLLREAFDKQLNEKDATLGCANLKTLLIFAPQWQKCLYPKEDFLSRGAPTRTSFRAISALRCLTISNIRSLPCRISAA